MRFQDRVAQKKTSDLKGDIDGSEWLNLYRFLCRSPMCLVQFRRCSKNQQVSPSSGTFIIRRFTLLELFSRSSMWSAGIALRACSLVIDFSALERASKFSPAVVSTEVTVYPSVSTISWKVVIDACIGTISAAVNFEVFALFFHFCRQHCGKVVRTSSRRDVSFL